MERKIIAQYDPEGDGVWTLTHEDGKHVDDKKGHQLELLDACIFRHVEDDDLEKTIELLRQSNCVGHARVMVALQDLLEQR